MVKNETDSIFPITNTFLINEIVGSWKFVSVQLVSTVREELSYFNPFTFNLLSLSEETILVTSHESLTSSVCLGLLFFLFFLFCNLCSCAGCGCCIINFLLVSKPLLYCCSIGSSYFSVFDCFFGYFICDPFVFNCLKSSNLSFFSIICGFLCS